MTHRFALALGGTLAILAALGSSACEVTPVQGDRGEGGCPVGEDCSEETPEGLFFGSPALGDALAEAIAAPRRLATGGTQTVRVYTDAEGENRFTGFAAEVSPPLALVGVQDSEVVVRGDGAGTGVLRLVDDAGLLYDRISLDVAEVAVMAVLPFEHERAHDVGLVQAVRPNVAFHVGRALPVVTIALFDAQDERLVDESITYELPAGFEASGFKWDRITIDEDVGAGVYTLAVVRTVGTQLLELTIVDDVDAVTSVPSGSEDSVVLPGRIATGVSTAMCFRALKDDRAVVGAKLLFEVSENLQLEASGTDTCAHVIGTQPGVGTLTVSVDDVVASYEVTVTSAVQRPSVPRGRRVSSGPRAGERAAR